MRIVKHLMLALALGTLISAVGCEQPQPATKSTAAAGDHGHDHAHGEAGHSHGHGAGPHEGTLADWGGGKYHVEFTVDHDKKEATVYILGGDEKTPAPIKTDKVLLSIKQPVFEVQLAAKPLDGETDGKASRFVGTHDSLGVVQEFAGTISSEIEGTPFAGDFAEEAHVGHEHK